MRALVTGATGFLGKSLVRELLGEGALVCCIVRSNSDVAAFRAAVSPDASDRLEVLHGDLVRIASWAGALGGCDAVYHLASALSGSTASLFATNVVATRGLVAAVLRAEVRRFVLISSLAVYDTAKLRAGAVVDETCPLDPQPHRRDPYTYSKIAQEKVAWEGLRDARLPVVVVRPGVIYGPGRDCISGRVGLRLGSFLLQMGGSQKLPYTFFENCARGVALAGMVPGIEGQAFNLIDDDPPTARKLLGLYRRNVGRLHTLAIPGVAIGPLSGLCEMYHHWSRGQLPAVLTRYKSRAMWTPFAYSNDKAKSVMGWAPQVGFAEGLERTFESFRQTTLPKVPAASRN